MARTIATTTQVDLNELLDFVRPRHRMILLTTRAGGGVQASPVTGGVDGDGRVVIASYPERAKSANVRSTPGKPTPNARYGKLKSCVLINRVEKRS